MMNCVGIEKRISDKFRNFFTPPPLVSR